MRITARSETGETVTHRGFRVVVVESSLIPDVWAYQVWKEKSMVQYKAGYARRQKALDDGIAAVDNMLGA